MYKKALVLGMGTSGRAAAELLLQEGSKVVIIDAADNGDLRLHARGLRGKGARVMLGADSVPEGVFDVCIVSPGISSDSKWVRNIESRSVEVLSELELGASRCKYPMLAVTGSKGKSTLVKFCGDILSLAGKRVAIAGNYGPPLCGVVAREQKMDWIVVEVSSFQLEKVRTFRPAVGILLNLLPDHLDRHGSMAAYAEMKSRLFRNMTEEDSGIVLDKALARVRRMSKGRCRWVSVGRSPAADYRYNRGLVCFGKGAKRTKLNLRGTSFGNDILGIAAAAAAAAAEACGVDTELVHGAAASYEPLPHRMQNAGEIKGVKFINDSKATNLAALVAGVNMCNGSVRLIAGGLLKEDDLSFVKKTLAKRVAAVYLIGKAAKKMKNAWGNAVKCVNCVTLEKAIRSAWHEARRGEVIVLSPGCASFDQFKNFEDRGKQFIHIVKSIHQEEQ